MTTKLKLDINNYAAGLEAIDTLKLRIFNVLQSMIPHLSQHIQITMRDKANGSKDSQRHKDPWQGAHIILDAYVRDEHTAFSRGAIVLEALKFAGGVIEFRIRYNEHRNGCGGREFVLTEGKILLSNGKATYTTRMEGFPKANVLTCFSALEIFLNNFYEWGYPSFCEDVLAYYEAAEKVA